MLVYTTSNVILLKAQLGSSPWEEGKACLERHKLEREEPHLSCIAVFVWTFLFSCLGCPVIPFCLKPLSSRAETEAWSWDWDGQGRVGPGVHRVQDTGRAGSSPQEGAWLAQHGQAFSPHRAKKPFDSKASSVQSEHWKSKPCCTLSTSSPRCQCLNLVATFRRVNLFQR